MKKYRICSQILLLIISIVILPAARGYSFTIAEEKEVGEKLLYSVRKAFPLMEDPDIVQYITALGDEVLNVAGVQIFDYRFHIIDSQQFNAFAAPSGLIFFYTGLVETMNNENEFVAVMSHEIGHVVKRHLASRMEKGKVVSVASVAVALAGLALGDAQATAALITGALATGQSANLHFSRQHEEEADLTAYQWLKGMHRDPEGMRGMLKTMRRITRYRSGQIPQYLLTHPEPEARLEYIQALMDKDSMEELTYKKVDNVDFLRFKYRVLSSVSYERKFKEYLTSVIQSEKSTDEQKIMAEYGMSQVDFQQNEYASGLKRIEKVINFYPEKSMFLVDRGILKMGTGQIESSVSDFKEAMEKDAENLWAVFNLAEAYFRLNNLEKSKACFQEVVYGIPEYSKGYYKLGQIASMQKQDSLATFYLAKYNLFEGKLKLAKQKFNLAAKDEKLPANVMQEIKEYQETIERLED